jgi:hypothetical protein
MFQGLDLVRRNDLRYSQEFNGGRFARKRTVGHNAVGGAEIDSYCILGGHDELKQQSFKLR